MPAAPIGLLPRIQWRTCLLVLSIAVFAASLTQPAFYFGQSAAPSSGAAAWRLLLEGWRALPRGYIEWSANPILFFSWLLNGRLPCLGSAAAVTALALMSLFLTRHGFIGPGGRPQIIVALGAGYWLWLCSALLMVCAGSALFGEKRRLQHEDES
jgi:hypothetical protein